MTPEEQFEKICGPTMGRIEDYCRKIFNILEGNNGAPGMKDYVARLDERVKVNERWRKWNIALGTTILGSVIVAILLFLILGKR